MIFIMRLKIFFLFFLLSNNALSYELFFNVDEQVSLIIDVCEFYRTKSVIFLYAESRKDLEMITMTFKWTRALSQEGFMVTNLNFSQLHRSLYYVDKILSPLYTALIFDYNDFNEFSSATNNFDMNFAAWLIIFINNGSYPNYCQNPPLDNIFHLRFDTKMIVRCNKENILREWYSIDKNKTEIDDVALWSLENGIKMIAHNILYHRRNNLKGMVMRLVTTKNSPFVKINENGKLNGIFGRIFEELCLVLNFTFQIVTQMEDYGILYSKNNSWSGVIGELTSGRADISISDFTMTSRRFDAIDFTYPFIKSEIVFVIKEPEILAFKWSSFLLTFNYSIWISTLAIIIISSILFIYLKMKIVKNKTIKRLLSDNFLEVWGIFCQQGLSDFPDNSSLRIAYFSIFILAVVLSTAYSAILISFLTTPVHILPFHSLEEFAEDGTYQLYVHRGSYFYDLFMNSKEQIAQKVWKLMIKNNNLSTNLEIKFNTLCKNKKIALFTIDTIMKYVNFKIPCNVVSIKSGQHEGSGMILSKKNQFTEIINFQLQKFMESGLIYRAREKSFKNRMNSIDKIKLEPVPITSVISSIFIILFGIVLSTFILIIEIYIFFRKEKKKLILKKKNIRSISSQRHDIITPM